jgi:hypothetical protein
LGAVVVACAAALAIIDPANTVVTNERVRSRSIKASQVALVIADRTRKKARPCRDGKPVLAWMTAALYPGAEKETPWNDATRTLTIGARTGAFPGMLTDRTFHAVVAGPTNAVGYSGATPAGARTVDYHGVAATAWF